MSPSLTSHSIIGGMTHWTITYQKVATHTMPTYLHAVYWSLNRWYKHCTRRVSGWSSTLFIIILSTLLTATSSVLILKPTIDTRLMVHLQTAQGVAMRRQVSALWCVSICWNQWSIGWMSIISMVSVLTLWVCMTLRRWTIYVVNLMLSTQRYLSMEKDGALVRVLTLTISWLWKLLFHRCLVLRPSLMTSVMPCVDRSLTTISPVSLVVLQAWKRVWKQVSLVWLSTHR